jgi:hypothetical protein
MSKLDLDGSAAHPDGWPPVLDKLLVGVTHNISNRVAALAGVSDILSGDSAIPPILRALADEIPKLTESLRLLRLLAGNDDEAEEALEATRVADDAILLADLHPACKNVRFEIEGRREAPPVIARPTALTHQLVVALTSAASDLNEAADDEGAHTTIPISFGTDGLDLVILVGASAVRARLLTAARDFGEN